MGEDINIPPEMARYTVEQAADILGITEGAVRNRLSRKTLRSVMEDGTRYVLLPHDISRDVDRDAGDTPPRDPRDVLVDELRDRLRYVENQLEAERQAHAEARRIIGGLVQRIPELEPPRASPERAGPTVDTSPGEAEDDARREQGPQRPWWRRVFGG